VAVAGKPDRLFREAQKIAIICFKFGVYLRNPD